MDIRLIPLDQLHFGHEADPPINIRKVGREAAIVELAATIAATRLGQPLNVKEIDGKVYVGDGNRRLAALRHNVDAGILAADWPVPCDFDPIDDELALALNIERVAMHDADRVQKFGELQARGLSVADIGSRFGMEPARVHRILALGNLSPVILDAWREGKMGDRPDEVVRAFTMAPKEDQERVFAKLSKSGQLWGHTVRQELGLGGNRDTANMLKEIGVAAYKKAGGVIVEDLFGDNHHVADPQLVKKLWDAKLADLVLKLKAEGWSWVEMASDLPYSWISVTYGVVKPKPVKVEKPKGSEPEPATISDAMMQRLSVQLTHAVKDSITARPQVALAAIVAGLAAPSSYGGIPVRVHASGILKEPREAEQFHDVLKRTLSMSVDELLAALAAEVRFALDLQSANRLAPPLGKAGNTTLIVALDQAVLQEALRHRFDAEDYFKTVPRTFTEAAIAEAVGPEEAKGAGRLKKGELVKFAVEKVPPTGWLPPELRTSTYAGPKGKPAKKSAKVKEAA